MATLYNLKKYPYLIWRFRPLKLFVIFFAAFMIIFISRKFITEIITTTTKSTTTTKKPSKSHPKKFLISTPGCSIIDEDPFDPEVLRLRDPRPPLRCDRVEDRVVYNDDSSIWADEHAAAKRNISECAYARVLPEYSANATKVEPFPFNKKVYINSTLVLVTCKTPEGTWWTPANSTNFTVMVWLKYRDENLVRVKEAAKLAREKLLKGSKPASPPFNFIIIVNDAVSRLNSIRSLPLTRKFLKEAGAIEMLGYTKVACCSLGNTSPMLAGRFTDGTFNITGAIWFEMAKQGFFTLASDDWVLGPNALYDFQKNDYDLGRAIRIKFDSLYSCSQGMMSGSALLDFMETIIDTHRDHGDNLFSFISPTYWSHDKEDNLINADRSMLQTFQRLRDAGDLDRTVVFVLGDHGPRFGDIVTSRVGRYEQRHPQSFLLLPDWFRTRFPALAKAAQLNARRLTTPFDVHATLRHLLHLQTNATPWRNDPSVPGISLLTKIPTNRNCSSAFIEEDFCGCRTVVPASKEEVREAGLAAVDAVNKALENWHNVCVEFRLAEVRHIEKRVDEDKEVYWMDVLMDAKPATFSATIIKNSTRYEVKTIYRLDACGKCGDCIKDPDFSLKEKCVCKYSDSKKYIKKGERK